MWSFQVGLPCQKNKKPRPYDTEGYLLWLSSDSLDNPNGDTEEQNQNTKLPQILKERELKYGSEEKGSLLYKCSILLGFILSKNLRGL